jgi:hypothetical protein
MKDRQEYIFNNSLIRGIMGTLKDFRMEQTDIALQYLMDVTNSTTEDDIIPLLRGKSSSELMEINLRMGSFLKANLCNSTVNSLSAESYTSYSKYKGD